MADDRQLFKSTARFYSQYRAKYPPELFKYLKKTFHLDGTGRLLDLGCGTGFITLPLAPLFQEGIGLDPEQEMLDEAAKTAMEAKIANIRWVCDKAENIGPDLGSFQLITLGRAIHWMDQATVLDKSHKLLQKNGGLVIIRTGDKVGSNGWKEDEEEWKNARRRVIMRYLGPKRRAGKGTFQETRHTTEAIIRSSAFKDFTVWSHPYYRKLTLDEAANEVYSLSYASPSLFGNNLSDFDREMRNDLLKAEPSAVFTERVNLQAMLLQKT